jgi:hypothetical protein
LRLDRTTHHVDDAGERNEQSIAGDFDDAAAVFSDLGINKLAAVSGQSSQSAFLVYAHEPTVASHVGGEGPPAYPGISGHEPDLDAARRSASEVAQAMAALKTLAPGGGSHFAESNFFVPGWQQAYWGLNYPRLLEVKRKYDPAGLFIVHHGVGSEAWSTDGFAKVTAR